MKKEEFIALGLTEELAIKCEASSLKELESLVPKQELDELKNEKKKLESSIKDRDTQLEELKNSTGDLDALKKQIETLQTDNKAKEEKHIAEIKSLKIETALDKAITLAKGKNAKAIKALLDLENAEIDTDGTIKGLSKQLETLAGADDSKFMFDLEPTQPKLSGATPGEPNKQAPDSGVDLSQMGYSDICKYLDANPNGKL